MDVGAGLYMYDVIVKKFTFAISSRGKFLFVFSFFITLFMAALRSRCIMGPKLLLSAVVDC